MFLLRTYQFPTEKSMGAEMGWIARNLADGQGFRVGNYYAWMAPLYPFLMSMIFRLLGSYSSASAIATLVMQSIYSSLTVIPLYFIGKALFNPRVGFITAFLWASNTSSLKYAIRVVWSSSLTALGMALMIILFLRLSRRPVRLRDSCLCGLVIGLAALNDPVVLIFIPFAALWMLWRAKDDFRAGVVHLTVIGIIAIALLMPWMVRNYRIFHRFVPIKSTFGVNLWLGNHGPNINQATAGLGFWDRVEELLPEEEVTFLMSLNEMERDRIFRDKAIDFIFDNPDIYIKYTVQRIYLFWRHSALQLDGISLVPFYLLAWIGIITSKHHWRDTILLLLLFAAFPIPNYLTIAHTHRFRFPIEGLLLVFVSYAVSYFLNLLVPETTPNVTGASLAASRQDIGV